MSNEIKINGVSKVEKSYEKQITFTRGDETYYATLYWESNEGFELAFVNADGKGIDTPEWAINWEDEEIESLEFTLDDLTDVELAS